MAEKKIYKVTPKTSQSVVQAYLTKANSKIVFTEGTYLIKKPYILYSDTEIELEEGAILKRMAKCYVFQTNASQKTTKYNGCHDIYIHGEGKIVCNGCTKATNIISLFHAKNIRITDIEIKDNVGSHAIEINSSYNVMISRVYFNGKTQAKGGEFREQVQIDYSFQVGLPLFKNAKLSCYDGTPCKKIVVKNCRFEGGNIAIGTHTCLNTENRHNDILIENNMFNGDGVIGGFGAFCRLMGMDNVTIKGNRLYNAGRLVEIITPNHFYNEDSTKVNNPSTIVKGCSNINIVKNTIVTTDKTFKYNGIYVKSGFTTIDHTDITTSNNKMGTTKSNIEVN